MVPRVAFVLGVCALLLPMTTSAFPFGGRITLYHICHNETIFARLSPPVPGDYVYVDGYTKVYQFGPPRAVGQWLLGLTGIPFDCLWSVNPIFPVPAIAITMMGSSGSPAGQPLAVPTISPGGNQGSGGYTSDPTQPAGTQTSPGFIGAQTGRVLISEVFYDVDAQHGTDPTHEWVEIYNGTSVSQNLSGWSVQDGVLSDVLPGGTQLAPNSFLVVAQTADIKNFWNIPSGVTVIALGSPIGNGLADGGDSVFLRNASGSTIDAVSWGTSTSAFTPSVPVVPVGQSLSRSSLLMDSDRASDWRGVATPTPGR